MQTMQSITPTEEQRRALLMVNPSEAPLPPDDAVGLLLVSTPVERREHLGILSLRVVTCRRAAPATGASAAAGGANSGTGSRGGGSRARAGGGVARACGRERHLKRDARLIEERAQPMA
jgi:hypothetical protein